MAGFYRLSAKYCAHYGRLNRGDRARDMLKRAPLGWKQLHVKERPAAQLDLIGGSTIAVTAKVAACRPRSTNDQTSWAHSLPMTPGCHLTASNSKNYSAAIATDFGSGNWIGLISAIGLPKCFSTRGNTSVENASIEDSAVALDTSPTWK